MEGVRLQFIKMIFKLHASAFSVHSRLMVYLIGFVGDCTKWAIKQNALLFWQEELDIMIIT